MRSRQFFTSKSIAQLKPRIVKISLTLLIATRKQSHYSASMQHVEFLLLPPKCTQPCSGAWLPATLVLIILKSCRFAVTCKTNVTASATPACNYCNTSPSCVNLAQLEAVGSFCKSGTFTSSINVQDVTKRFTLQHPLCFFNICELWRPTRDQQPVVTGERRSSRLCQNIRLVWTRQRILKRRLAWNCL